MKIFISGGIGDELCATPLIRELRRLNPDEMIRVEKSFYSSLFLHNPHLNVGNIESGRRFGPFNYFDHQELGNMAYSFGLQVGMELKNLQLEIFLTDEERSWGRKQVEHLQKPIVAIDTSANWKSRRWNSGWWGIVAKEIMDQGISVVEVGKHGPDEWGWERHTKVPCHTRFTDRTTLRQVAAILAACDLFAGNDSGMFHLSAAVGTPQVILFSNKRPKSRAHYDTVSLEDSAPCHRSCFSFCGRRTFCLDQIPWRKTLWRVLETLEIMGFPKNKPFYERRAYAQ